ncbi:hypothetical protein PMAYCL1PPCAC_03230, partial [Pristionchus mayeri]
DAAVMKEEEEKENRTPWEDEAKAHTGESKEKAEEMKKEDWSDEYCSDEDDDLPWDDDKSSMSTVVEVKEEEDEKENHSPWENLAKIDSGVRKSNEKIEESEDKSPWDDDQAKGDCVVRKPEKMIGKKKKGEAPWDDIEANAGVEKERSPWEGDETQPFMTETNDDAEPWNQMNGRSKKDDRDAVEAQKAVSGLPIEKMGGKTEVAPPKNVKEAASAKPASRVKDWNAICAELSDMDLARGAERFVSDFVALLRVYCNAIDTADFESLKRHNFNIDEMLSFTATFNQTIPAYGRVCDALKEEIRRLAVNIQCHTCNYNITTPRHLLHHFVDAVHGQNANVVSERWGGVYTKMTDLVSSVFYRFISPQATINELMRVELEHLEKGRERATSGRYPVLKLRPTAQFMNSYSGKNLLEVGNHLSKQFPAGPFSMTNKEMSSDARRWVEANKQRLEKELRTHLEEGIPFCSPCAAIFESIDEYYQHMTTYNHVGVDKSLYARDVVLCKGRDYGDAML